MKSSQVTFVYAFGHSSKANTRAPGDISELVDQACERQSSGLGVRARLATLGFGPVYKLKTFARFRYFMALSAKMAIADGHEQDYARAAVCELVKMPM